MRENYTTKLMLKLNEIQLLNYFEIKPKLLKDFDEHDGDDDEEVA